MSKLFSPITLGSVVFKNRIFVSPMCQYSAKDGVPNDWHFVHLGSRAVGGAALVIAEATSVLPEGRISLGCTGLWNEEQTKAFQKIASFVKSQGSKIAIQLGHAGRKASMGIPWEGEKKLEVKEGGWTPVAPSPIPFSEKYHVPRELKKEEIQEIVQAFEKATKRADEAGFDVIELHMAHGYLAHEFMSPLSNQRQDEYGGSFENRIRYSLEVVKKVRKAWSKPLFVRISATDWLEGGWDLDQSIRLAKELKQIGVDLIDCSSGGNLSYVKIPLEPGYQVPFSEAIRKQVEIPTSAVGLITEPLQAEKILQEGKADVISMAREFLRDPYFPLRAAKELGAEIDWPKPYLRAK